MTSHNFFDVKMQTAFQRPVQSDGKTSKW